MTSQQSRMGDAVMSAGDKLVVVLAAAAGYKTGMAMPWQYGPAGVVGVPVQTVSKATGFTFDVIQKECAFLHRLGIDCVFEGQAEGEEDFPYTFTSIGLGALPLVLNRLNPDDLTDVHKQMWLRLLQVESDTLLQVMWHPRRPVVSVAHRYYDTPAPDSKTAAL